MWAIGEPSGPMLNGITYIVRPFIEPRNSFISVDFISAGSTQLFVGPASSRFLQQMNVWSSTRATSAGSERQRKLLGRSVSSSLTRVPDSTIPAHSASYSSCEPSHQWT